MIRSLIRALLFEEYFISNDRDPDEFTVAVPNGYVYVKFMPDIQRFRMRGYIGDSDSMEPAKTFTAYTNLETKGSTKSVVFKLPGTPMTSEFNDGDRTSIARVGRNVLMQVYNGSDPSRPLLRDLLESHTADLLVQTGDGFDIRPPRISREERAEYNREINDLYAANNEIKDYITAYPGMASDPDVVAEMQRIRDRVAEISRLLNIRVS
jgi:hypothetical protein